MARDFVASRPVTAGSRPARTASTNSPICRAWNGARLPLIAASEMSSRSPVPNGDRHGLRAGPGTAQTSLTASEPSGYSASPTVAPVVPVTLTRVPSPGVSAVEAARVASPPEANRSVATAVSSTSMAAPCFTVACAALTSTHSPMNHASRSMLCTAWVISTPPPSVAQVPRHGSAV